MTSGWAAYSGACDDERALAAIEGGLRGIERPHRVLLLQTPFYEHSQPYPAASPTIPPGYVRTAVSTAMARPGSSTASCTLL